MNRKERRAREKELGCAKKARATPLMPVNPKRQIEALMEKYPEVVSAVKSLEKQCNNDGKNEVFNALLGCMLITLHDKYDFDSEKLNTLIAQIISQLECIKLGFVSVEDILGVLNEIGVIIEDMDYDAIRHSSQETIERLKTYTEMVIEMTKQEKAFELFDQGILDVEAVAEKTGSATGSVYKYKQLWKQAKMAQMTPDEFSEFLLATPKEHVEGVQLPKQAIVETQESLDQVIVENHIVEVEKMVAEKNKGDKKMGLKKVVKVVSIEGEFATYEPVEQAWSIVIDEQVIMLSREQMKTLAEEFTQVAEEEV